MLCLGYRYLDRRIPDELHVEEDQESQVQKVLEHPLLTFEDSVSVSGEGSYTLKCSILGVIPFKEIKVTPSVSPSVYVSGSTAGIYMETDGVLIIDTGEILSEEGTTEEPAKDVVKPGDYIVAFDSQTIRSKKDLNVTIQPSHHRQGISSIIYKIIYHICQFRKITLSPQKIFRQMFAAYIGDPKLFNIPEIRKQLAKLFIRNFMIR